MTRVKRLTDVERAEILRETAEGISTAELAARFGVTPRAIQYTRQREAKRRRDIGVAQAAVTVKLTPEELAALDEVLSEAGIATRTEGLRRLIQAAGGTFVPDARLATELLRFRAALHEVGNGVVRIAKQMTTAGRAGQGDGAELSDLRLAQVRALARFILDAADEIDLLVRRRRESLQLEVTAGLREFAHAAE